MILTEKLDLLLSAKGINRREFSSQSGIPYMTIVNFYEKGTENVKLSTLKKIANYLEDNIEEDHRYQLVSLSDRIGVSKSAMLK